MERARETFETALHTGQILAATLGILTPAVYAFLYTLVVLHGRPEAGILLALSLLPMPIPAARTLASLHLGLKEPIITA